MNPNDPISIFLYWISAALSDIRMRRGIDRLGSLHIISWLASSPILLGVTAALAVYLIPTPPSYSSQQAHDLIEGQSLLAPLMGIVGFFGGVIFGLIAGVIHIFLRGVLMKALYKPSPERPPNRLPYRLINLCYGLVLGLALWFLAISPQINCCGTELNLLPSFGEVIVIWGVAGLVIGEVLRGQYEKGTKLPAASPPKHRRPGVSR
jgi:hypothetical protein